MGILMVVEMDYSSVASKVEWMVEMWELLLVSDWVEK